MLETYKGWTPAQAAAAIARLPEYAECMSQFNIDIDGNELDEEATEVNFMDAVDLLELDGVEPPSATTTLISQRTALVQQIAQLQAAVAAIDEQIVASLTPVVEPVPAKPKSVPQQKSVDNARIALANKGKSAKEKAEALDVPVATVKKVEKAKEVQALAKAVEQGQAPALKAADLRKLAKELNVDVSKVDFRSKPQRQALQKQLQDKQASAKQWSGLSASRQAELNKLARTSAN